MTRAMRLRQPTSRGNSALSTFETPAPGPGAIRVRLRAGPLNFRDTLAVGGASDRRSTVRLRWKISPTRSAIFSPGNMSARSASTCDASQP